MKFSYMWRTDKMADVEVDFIRNTIKVINYTDDIIKRPFGRTENPDMEYFNWLIESRCFPKGRANCKQLLNDLGLDHYDPLQIVFKTHGRQLEDYAWIKFEGEEIDYEKDIKLRD